MGFFEGLKTKLKRKVKGGKKEAKTFLFQKWGM